jgi:hypothetical protein
MSTEGWDSRWDSDARRALAHRLLDVLLGFEPETQDSDEGEAPAPAQVQRAPAPKAREDGLYWDASSEPDLAKELEAFRSKRSNKPGLGHSWELARQHPAEWVMRAFAHSALRWATGPAKGWVVNDAWGLFWKALGELRKGRGEWAGLEFDARHPDARDAFRAGLAALQATSDAAARVLRRAGLKIAEQGPTMDELLERSRKGAKLIGLPQRLPSATGLVESVAAEGPTKRTRTQGTGQPITSVGSMVAKLMGGTG